MKNQRTHLLLNDMDSCQAWRKKPRRSVSPKKFAKDVRINKNISYSNDQITLNEEPTLGCSSVWTPTQTNCPDFWKIHWPLRANRSFLWASSHSSLALTIKVSSSWGIVSVLQNNKFIGSHTNKSLPPSLLPSYLPSFLPSNLPTYLPTVPTYCTYLPTYLPIFLPSFLSCCSSFPSSFSSFLLYWLHTELYTFSAWRGNLLWQLADGNTPDAAEAEGSASVTKQDTSEYGTSHMTSKPAALRSSEFICC